MCRPFQADLCEALVVVHPGEAQQAVQSYSSKSPLKGEELALDIQRNWFKIVKHCRRVIPEPGLLLYRFDQLIITYSCILDAATGEQLQPYSTYICQIMNMGSSLTCFDKNLVKSVQINFLFIFLSFVTFGVFLRRTAAE